MALAQKSGDYSLLNSADDDDAFDEVIKQPRALLDHERSKLTVTQPLTNLSLGLTSYRE